jgi:hypothetical protein
MCVLDEELIKHGWDNDVWFHADNLSSAHIYVRLPEGEDWEKMTKELLVDCAQLTKANSIEGNKKDNVTIVYTPWSNLKKDGSMAVGQVGFKDQRKVSSHMSSTHRHFQRQVAFTDQSAIMSHANTGLGEANACREAGESNRQPTQQNQD